MNAIPVVFAFAVGFVVVLIARRGSAAIAPRFEFDASAVLPAPDDRGVFALASVPAVDLVTATSPAAVVDVLIPRGADMAQRWTLPATGERYADLIAQAANAHGVPPDLLGRLLYQESRFRPEIIDGRVSSPAGALGIAQFMPATARERGVDPLNPASAIPGAAKYLRELRDRFGGWDKALAAYNWGQGNVARKGLDAMPAETRAYLAEILGDVGPV